MTNAARFGALVLAGGDGARMRSRVAKPLIEIRGASLLERNLYALIGAGHRSIWVACRHEQDAIRDEVERLAEPARRRGVALRCLLETAPLGTIGAAGILRGLDALVTVNADNLTALDLAALVARHTGTTADLTLATHDHATQLPYGAIDVDGDRVIGYREKPRWVTHVASAVCVLGPAALATIDGRTDLPALTQRMIGDGARVLAYPHAAPWIDVNQPDDVARAAALVAANPESFECWARPADLEVAGAILRDGDLVLLEHRRDVHLWDTPGGKLEPGEPADAAMVRELREELGVELTAGPERARFDMLDGDGRAIRHHVFAPAVRRTDVVAREGQTLAWFPLGALPADRAPVVGRSLAAAAHSDALTGGRR